MTADPTPDDDLWSWVDEQPDELAAAPSADAVTVVMVVRNGEPWLADALRSVQGLVEAPAAVVVVDNASTDGSAEILANAELPLTVVQGEATWGFGQAVDAALAAIGSTPPTEWLWLLHDDVIVRSDALATLLQHTVRYPDADIIGPMLLRPTRRTQAPRVSELGVSISHTGRRELGFDPGEVAQGQHEPSDTLGVSTCGMLIRRSTYDDLGGFDPAVPLHRDGVELGWRASLAGHRVVTCPAARITHRQVGRAGRRPMTLASTAGRSPAAYDRTMAMRTVAAHATGPRAALVSLRLVLGSMLRALGYLLGKRVDLARDEIGAAGDFLRGRASLRALRRRIAAIPASADDRRRTERLRPGLLSSWAVGLDAIGRAVGERFRAFTSGVDSVTLDELTGDDFADRSSSGRTAVLPVLAVVAAAMVVLIAGRRLLGLGQLVSSGLLPAPDTAAAVWASYITPPAGHAGEHPIWLGLAALASLPFVVPGWAAVAALLVGVPTAAMTCAWYLEPYVFDLRARWLTSVLYGLLPVLVGGYSRGQVWLVAWAVVLPLFGVAVRTWGLGQGLDRWRSPAGAALALTVLSAIAPLALPIGAACLVAVAHRRRVGLARALVAVAAAVLLLLSWAPALLRHPGRLLTGPEPLLGTLEASSPWALFLGRSAGPGLPPLWLSVLVFGLLWLGAAVAMYVRGTAWGVWASAVAGVILAVVLSRFVVPLAGGSARPEVTMWLVAAFGVLLVGSATAVDRARADLESADFGLGQALILASTVVGALALVISLGWWVWGGVAAPLTRSDTSSVPVYVRDAEVAQRSRALLVSVHPEGVSWYLDQPDHPRWGDAEGSLVLGGSAEGVAAARTVVAQTVSGHQVDGLAADLATLGVSHLRVSGAGPDIVTTLNSTPGLQRGAEDAAGSVWLVVGKPSTVQVRDGAVSSYVAATVPSGAEGRVLLIAEPPDARRVVTVGEVRLEIAPSPDWRAAYALGTASGPLTVRLDSALPWWVVAQILGLALLALFAAPSIRRDEEEGPAVAPRRASASEEVRS